LQKTHMLIPALILVFAGLGYAAPTVELKWNFTGMDSIESPPAVADLNGDGTLDVVFGANTEEANWIYAVSGTDASELWRYGPVRGTVSAIIVDDINGDDMIEVVFAATDGDDGDVIVLNGPLGGLLWKQSGYPKGTWSNVPAVADIDGDGDKEVLYAPRGAILGGSEFNTTAFDAISGDVVWRSPRSTNYKAPVQVVDMDGDGILEVVTIGPGWGWVVDARNGQAKYVLQYCQICDGNFIVTEVNGDGVKDVIAMGDHQTRAFTADTSELAANVTFLWEYHGNRTAYNDMAAADFDGDGKLEVLHFQFTRGGDPLYTTMFCRNVEDGTLLWDLTFQGKFAKTSPALGDLDEDGLPDILVGVDAPDCALLVKGTDGTVMWNATMRQSAHFTGCIADVDGDEKLDLIVGNEDDMLCYGTSTPCAENEIVWGMINRDIHNSAIFPMPQASVISVLGLLALVAVSGKTKLFGTEGRNR